MNEPNPYSEDELIEQPTIDILAETGWETLNCYSEFNQGDSPLGRQTKSEVVLIPRLQAALKRLNPDCNPRSNRQSNRGTHPLPRPDEQC